MPLTAYLKIDGIDGESRDYGHEDEIEISGIRWGAELQSVMIRSTGRRARQSSRLDPLVLNKFMDAASVYLLQACRIGARQPEAVLTVQRPDISGANQDYLTITMENVVVTAVDMINDERALDSRIMEELSLVFETVTVAYVEPNNGATHSVEMDAL